MTTLHRDRRWKIQVFGREHGAPHFHVWTPGGAAVISIEDLSVLSGFVDTDAMAQAKEWAKSHRAAIAAEWNRLNPEKLR
jgi:Domain of unknown function (DUF4160)